jgi:hypothetical protein
MSLLWYASTHPMLTIGLVFSFRGFFRANAAGITRIRHRPFIFDLFNITFYGRTGRHRNIEEAFIADQTPFCVNQGGVRG